MCFLKIWNTPRLKRANLQMTELSRGELIAWVNDLTQLNVPKVESLGTGAAHCLIIHSIYGDLPVHKINFKAIHEYEYVHNFKVLQEAFTRHRIDRVVLIFNYCVVYCVCLVDYSSG